MAGFLSKLFGGNKSEKDVKKITPVVAQINKFFAAYASISNDELRANSDLFRSRIQQHLAGIDAEITAKKAEGEAMDAEHLSEKDAIYQQVDKLEKLRNEKIEEVLNEILPEAFATIKEAARRFSTNTEIISTATALDRDLSVKKAHVTIDGDKSIYKNTWLAAGGEVTWNMVHYDVQLIGGAVLHSGKISEMATGEGKILVSTLPAYLNAITGEGVHVVTVNDYLARRDSEWNGPLFEWLGVTVD